MRAKHMSEALQLSGEDQKAGLAMAEAAYAHAKAGRLDQASKCRQRAEQILPGSYTALEAERGPIAGLPAFSSAPAVPQSLVIAAPGPLDEAGIHVMDEHATAELEREPVAEAPPAIADEIDDGDRSHAGPPRLPASATEDAPEPLSAEVAESVHAVGAEDDSASDYARALAAMAAVEAPLDDEPVDDVMEITEDDTTEAQSLPGLTGVPTRPPRLNPPAENSEFERFPSSLVSGQRPSVRFDAPALERVENDETVPSFNGAHAASDPELVAAAEDRDAVEIVEVPESAMHVDDPPAAAEESPKPTVADIERLLASAQEHFRSGDREGAGGLLVEAACAYERIERYDNAASIFRSLARGPQSSPRLLELWLDNCVRRDDRREAAEVACELGDRAVNDANMEAARGWFERACGYDSNNAVAQRRLARLAQLSADASSISEPVAVSPVMESPMAVASPEPVAVAPEIELGRVEMAVGRSEAVTFDLGSLLAEFQRGIEAQLSGDAQSHYDLAMTYREMGLIEQAVDSFRLAAADPAFTYRSAEMIGRCLLDQGRFADAAHELAEALKAPQLPPDAVLGLRYQLGLAFEAAGDVRGALAEFERVFAAQSNYSDVAVKLRALRKAPESA